LIGLVLIGTGIVLQGALPVFWAVLLAQIVWGIGYTFTSGHRSLDHRRDR